MKNIIVTGLGAVTPIGNDITTFFDNACKGKSGCKMIDRFDTENLETRFACMISDFDASEKIGKKLARETDIFMHYAIDSMNQAIEQSQILSRFSKDRIAIVLGTSLSGITTALATENELVKSNSLRVSPRFVPKILGNLASAHIAMIHKITGVTLTLNTACSSGLDAIAEGMRLLQLDECDACIVCGADSAVYPTVIAGLNKAGALSTNNDDFIKACKPFDVCRDGFVIGEGAASLVLEKEDCGKNVESFGKIISAASNNDAYHPTSPNPSGIGAKDCMNKALIKASLKPADINYINAHGTATKLGDIMEASAINTIFGDKTAVSSTKSMHGHMMGAGGVAETILCLLSIKNEIIAPTINVDNIDEECKIDLVYSKAREAKINFACCNAFGFGGQNACVIVGK